MYCFQDKVLIGLSRENSDEVTINEKTVKMLEERAYSFYKHVGLDAKPKLWSDLENGLFFIYTELKDKIRYCT